MHEEKPPDSTYGIYGGCVGCNDCPQSIAERDIDTGYAFGGFVLPVLNDAKILVVGDQADFAEYKRGEVWSGMTGYQWAKILRSIKIKPENFSMTNVISCLPPKDWKVFKADAADSIDRCSQYVRTVVERENPDVIMTVGALPTTHFLGEGSLVEHHAPRRGYVFNVQYGKWSGYVVPSVHPRSLGQGKAAWTPLLMHDIFTALDVRNTGKPQWVEYNPEYVQYPTFADIDHFEQRAIKWLTAHPDHSMFTCDIETEESGKKEEAEYDEIGDAEITRISFAYRPGYAITIPFQREFFSRIQKLLDLPARFIVYWNWTFDHPRLLAKGFSINQEVYDGMELWHYYKTALPKSLGSVTPNLCRNFSEWKSLFHADDTFYSCVDSDAAISNVHKMIQKMPKTQYNAFLEGWIKVRPICQAMHEHGALMDMDKHDKLEGILISDLFDVDEEIQKLVPERIKPFKLYKMVPLIFRCRKCAGKGYTTKQRMKMGPCEVCDSTGQLRTRDEGDPSWRTYVRLCEKCKGKGKYSHKLPKEIHPCEACEEWGYLPHLIPEPWEHSIGDRAGYYVETSQDIRGADKKWRKTWGFKQKFLPTSPQQVADYLRDCGYPVPRNYHTDKETTDVKAIKDLMMKHENDAVLPQFLEYRQIKKMLGQYIDGYVPGEDGRIHTTFGQKATNLRFNSVKPNVQNVITRGKYAQLYRQQFIPRPGYVLAELDHSGAEAQIVGYYAKDPDYIRIAKLSIHGILASYVLVNDGTWKNPIDLAWSDEDITEAVDEIREKFPLVYAKSKNCAHGSNYGAVPYKLFMEYRDAFPKLAFAEEIQELYFNTVFKKGKQWHHDTWEFAYKNKFIENVYGYRFDFWDVLSPNWYGDLERDDKTGYWKLGKQAKDCLAFNPSSTEAGLMKEIMVWLHKNTDLLQWLVWMIHDSLVFELPDDLYLYDRLKVISAAMSKPVPQMGGLSIECGVDVGYNWGKRSATNPDGMTDYWTKFKSAA